MKPFSGVLTTAQYFRKAGNSSYGSFLIMGTFGGIGGVVIACTVSNSSLGSVINLLTGAAWSNTNLTITYSVTDGIGYVGLKTTSSSNSSGVIIGG
jgi:FtsH-binding integral membrane protein